MTVFLTDDILDWFYSNSSCLHLNYIKLSCFFKVTLVSLFGLKRNLKSIEYPSSKSDFILSPTQIVLQFNQLSKKGKY